MKKINFNKEKTKLLSKKILDVLKESYSHDDSPTSAKVIDFLISLTAVMGTLHKMAVDIEDEKVLSYFSLLKKYINTLGTD